jgi:hypothetical protein
MVILKEPRTSLFGNYKKEEKLDENTFNIWKSELLKELPAFWESMSESRKK